MKINLQLKIIFATIFIITKVASQEVQFESKDINIFDNGNQIVAKNTETKILSKKINIYSEEATYDKNIDQISFKGDVIFKDLKNEIVIYSDSIIYDKKKDIVSSFGNTEILVKNIYTINTKNIYYDRLKGKLYGKDITKIVDDEENNYLLRDNFEFNFFKNIIKAKNSIIIDKNINKYVFEDLIINLNKNEIAGKEIKVEFEKSYFGNDNNEPILKGRSAFSNDSELQVYKAVFSTCNIQDKKCRGWELNTEEFTHDKENKIFEYRDSWLKIFNYKIFYLPYFNHPDPSVKRKSGFLTPSYSTSDSFGTSINFPYFKVIDRDKDITFNPRYYADKSFLLQNEYRQVFKQSKIINDFSFLVGDAGTKGHIFYNQIGDINKNTNFEINLQNIKGDNYLKNHNLVGTSPLIKNDNLLFSNFNLNWNAKDTNFNTSFKVFEDLSRNYHDRYQYIYPDFNFSKKVSIPREYNGNFYFNSYGYNKNYDTNIIESVITNDFLFSSNEYINSKGLVTNYDLLLKNTSSYANNSANFEENSNNDLFGTFKIQSSLPLKKELKKHINILKPTASLRYSPNGNSDISSKDIIINYDNVFNMNRIGSQHQVEGGEALTLGLEFKRTNTESLNDLKIKVANVLKYKENIKLPTKSKLNKTRSDIFGNINYDLNNKLNIGYSFSYDRDLEYSNLEQLNLEYSTNNFLNNFSYYTEDNDIGNKESIKNFSSLNLNDENKISFEIAKNLKDDFTQYYDLFYTYQTDCISLNFKFNKTFFRDGNLEPNKNLSFLIRIIPFTELGVKNVKGIVGN